LSALFGGDDKKHRRARKAQRRSRRRAPRRSNSASELDAAAHPPDERSCQLAQSIMSRQLQLVRARRKQIVARKALARGAEWQLHECRSARSPPIATGARDALIENVQRQISTRSKKRAPIAA
jgi:hypothetical protein